MSNQKKSALEAKFDSYVKDGWRLEPVPQDVSNIDKVKKKIIPFSKLKWFRKQSYQLVSPDSNRYNVCDHCDSEMNAHFLEESRVAYEIISEIGKLSKREQIKYRNMYSKKE